MNLNGQNMAGFASPSWSKLTLLSAASGTLVHDTLTKELSERSVLLFSQDFKRWDDRTPCLVPPSVG